METPRNLLQTPEPHQQIHQRLRSSDTGEWLHQQRVRAVQKFDSFVTIDWMDDELEEHRQRLAKRRHAKTMREQLVDFSRTWVVLAAIGVAIGAIAASLNVITAWLAALRFGYCSSQFYLSKAFCCWVAPDAEGSCTDWSMWLRFAVLRYFVYLVFLALFLAVAALLVKVYAPFAAGSGISEIKCIVSGFVMNGFLGWATLAIKSLALPLAIALGLSLGKEGPSVHYAVSVGNSVSGLFRRYRESASMSREFLTAGAAAGVAVAFGSPMGGVLFSMEEISSVFQLPTLWKSYVCSFIAVATLAAFNPFRTGQLVLFEVTYDTSWHFFELPFYALLGVFGGLYGITVSKLNKRVTGFRKTYLADYAVREVVTLAVFTAMFCYFNEYLKVDMTEAMQMLFSECLSNSTNALCDPKSSKSKLIASLLFATVARLFLTVVTYGCKVPAGIFVPSMAAGATFGRAIGILVEHLNNKFENLLFFASCPEEGPCVIPGTYALIGAGAALSGITHLTVTVAVIMFELTGAVKYIIPTMVAVTITKLINDKWGQGGISDQMIVFNGLPFIDSKEEFIFDTTVGTAMSTVTVVFTSRDLHTVSYMRQILVETPYRGFPIVHSEENPRIVGYVRRVDVEEAIGPMEASRKCTFMGNTSGHLVDVLDLSSIVNPAPLVVNIDTTLEYLMDIFVRLGPRHVLVESNGHLAGTITRKDILRYEHTTHELHSPHVHNDVLDKKVWKKFQNAGEWIRKLLRRAGLAALSKHV
ncbi:hypothetical protein METBIDRAFT_11469 [Metschnikowia bicuspidata var. bicuspidata NRRL YB-4993]|uniref:Chloride channel protein n=1 Tax=Metschnikowia bicuspidata var. bicuspidata NRRL YB-4993 TaxID=869754 RepID=A0A1A0HA26_9ASCO|nr:hypothetical protein METBIDRAFT_11469 [Metschnikowia bicuspidata var. bicuspidata NRRL YB-4993]OBA20855.1 hypothetical protein METBIDRAFT_11469 [Metschnikowia bicuspidata var. bicuspidata NRRL YB-4993]